MDVLVSTLQFGLAKCGFVTCQSSMLEKQKLATKYSKWRIFFPPQRSCSASEKKKTIMQKINKEKQLDCGCVGVFVCTQPVICECSAGALLECCQRLLAVICVWLRVSSMCVCLVCVLVSGCRRHSCVASAPRHTPDTVLLFPRSSSDLSTFLSPSHTNTHTTLYWIHVFPF